MENGSEEDAPTCAMEQSCCRGLREEFTLLEEKMNKRHEELMEYINTMKECVFVRDEQLKATRTMLEEKDKIIEDLTKNAERSEKIIKDLTAQIKELTSTKNQENKYENNTKQKLLKRKPFKSAAQISREEYDKLFKNDNFSTFFIITFDQTQKRHLCPFQFEFALTKAIGSPPKNVSSSGRDSFLIEVANKSQSESIMNLDHILGFACKVSEHRLFNGTKGLIYIHNNEINDFDSFSEGLKEKYPITKIETAHWIKTRQESSKAFLVHFTGDPPPHLRITGEHLLTTVYPYKENPLQCRKCFQYGHSKARCSDTTPTCGRCSEKHWTQECEKVFDEEHVQKCPNCEGEHRAGHKSCPNRQYEDHVLEIQQTRKVGKKEARLLIEGKELYNVFDDQFQQEYVHYLQITIDDNKLRKSCPFKIENFFRTQHEIEREDIRRENNHFVIACKTIVQTNNLQQLKNILEIPCNVTSHNQYNNSKGLIYIQEFEITNFPSFAAALKERHGIHEVVPAHWIKPRNGTSKPFLLTFNSATVPKNINIPGEKGNTKIYQYKSKPLFCTKCLEYTHSHKNCNNPIRCRKCSLHHPTDQCQETPK
jgi:hypothetical protein